MDSLKTFGSDLKEIFSNVKQIYFPKWMRQPVLVDLSDVSMQYQDELSEVKNDQSVKSLFNL